MPANLADEHNHFPGLSRIGALLADPGRAAMLWALMDGSARPAGELTMIAGLSPSAASAHLARLTDGGLLALEVRGRHRYFRIASPDIAASIEALANVSSNSYFGISCPINYSPFFNWDYLPRHYIPVWLCRECNRRFRGDC